MSFGYCNDLLLLIPMHVFNINLDLFMCEYWFGHGKKHIQAKQPFFHAVFMCVLCTPVVSSVVLPHT